MSQWIKVEDVLPPPFVRVLAIAVGGYRVIAMVSDSGNWYDACCNDCGSLDDVITHWQPLPELPE